MESVQGSWQYETISSANETSYATSSSPTSPAMCGQMSPYADQGMWDDFNLGFSKALDDAFIGCGGEQQLLSATGNSINAVSPLKVGMEEKAMPMMFVDPNLVQPLLPCGDAAPIDFRADLEEFLGETIDFTTIATIDDTEAQEYLTVQPESLNEASVNLGSPVATKPVVQLDDLANIDAEDIVQESELEAALENSEAINFDEWLMDQDGELQEESTSFETSYDTTTDSNFNENSYLDSSSQMSSPMSSDAEDATQEQTIDALMRFDLPAAQAAIVNSSFAMAPVATFVVERMKPERRGRKPSTTTSAVSWKNVKDKSLRKKQQNKIAATKYRQKKKEEAKIGMVAEAKLQEEYGRLSQEQQRLADKIRQVKELLKEKYNL